MANLYLSVKGQTLTVKSDIDKIVENSINYLKINIDTSQDSEWSDPNLNIKCILSNKEESSAFYANNYITKDFLKAPGFVVHLVGYKLKASNGDEKIYEKLIPTNPVVVNIYSTGVLDADDEPEAEIEAGWADKVLSDIDTRLETGLAGLEKKQDDFENEISYEMEVLKNEQNTFISTTNEKIETMSNESVSLRKDLGKSIGEEIYNKDITSSLMMIDDKYYHKDSGNLTTYTGAKCTELFAVKEGERYIVSGSYGYYCALIAEFDENKTFVQGVGTSEVNVNTPTEGYEYVVPAGVSYIGCSTRRTADYSAGYRNIVVLKEVTEFNNIPDLINELEVKYDEALRTKQENLISGDNIKTINGQEVLGEGDIEISLSSPEFKEVIDAIGTTAKDEILVYDVDSDERVYTYEVIVGAYKVENGDFNQSKTSSRSTEKIPVKPNEVYTIDGTCTGTYALITTFDEEKNWIGSYGTSQLGGKYTFSSSDPLNPSCKYVVPEGISYIALTTDDATKVPLKVIGPVYSLRKIDDAISNETNSLKSMDSILQEEIDKTNHFVSEEFSKAKEVIGQTVYLEDITKTLTIEPGRISNKGGILVETDPEKEELGVHTLPFQVFAGEKYHVWGKYSTAQCIVAWYNEEQKFVNSIVVTEEGTTVKVADNETFVVPSTLMTKDGIEEKIAYMACSTINNKDNPLIIKKEVEKYNNVNDNIKEAIEDLSATKIDKVLVSPNGSEWVLTISNDGTLKAVKLRTFGEEVVTTLTLPNNLTAGKFTLKYENSDGVLSNYADICSLEITTEGEIVSYNGLIAENCAPKTATCIGIYDSFNVRAGGLDLGFLSNRYSDKLYTFSAIADIHIGVSDGIEDFTNAAKYFKDEDEIEFITVCGDMVNDSSQITELQAYQNIAGKITKPVYVVTGNHEANNYNDGEDFNSIKHFFTQEKYPNINQDLYYSFTYRNDVFIMVGTYGEPGYNKTFSLEELQWLHRTLEDNRNKRCFLYTHYYPIDGSGDPLGLYKGNGFNNQFGRTFLSLLKHYKNVIYFHGHTHTAFEVQEYHHMNNIDRNYGRYSIHIPSLTWPRIPNENMTDYDKKSSEGQGYIIDVYENGIALKGRDFEKGKFVPIGTYYLDTVPVVVEANTYRDPTGILTTPVAELNN